MYDQKAYYVVVNAAMTNDSQLWSEYYVLDICVSPFGLL